MRESIKRMIEKYGCTMRVPGGSEEWRAVIQPLRYRNKLYVEEVSVPAGMIDRAAYLYIGLPENDLTVYPRGTLFECCGEIMTLTHTEVTRINDRDEYVWAIFNYYGKKESEGGEDAQNA